MAKIRHQANAKRIREVLEYDQNTGIFRWKKQLAPRGPLGAVAGVVASHGYRVIRIDGRFYTGHRLAWLHVHGEMPRQNIDHINGSRDDNRIANLRICTQSQNSANMRKKIKSATGFRGVYPYSTGGTKFEARAMKDGKTIRFGIFTDPSIAYAAYCAGMKRLFADFANVV